MITAYGSTETAIEAMRQGAYDFILKPFELSELKRTIASAVEDNRLIRESVSLPDKPLSKEDGMHMIGSSAAMQEVYKLVGKVSRSDISVLITGPSGSGKEMVARAIYHYSSRRNQPFQAVNCAALPAELLESELFGHERGAFTGATETRIGRFERCNKGTLFLDEIGDMPKQMQAKILRVIQEQAFERVGGTETIHVDVRLLAATNQNLEELVARGAFREDLYFRLSVVNINLPPLSERRSDIPELVNYFMNRYQQEGVGQNLTITEPAMKYLSDQPWKGNVRELQNAIQRAMVLCPGQVLREKDFEFLHGEEMKNGQLPLDDMAGFARKLMQKVQKNPEMKLIPAMERLLIETALRETGGNQVQAAKLLGISRNTLRNRIEKYSLDSE
jgi:DNA-binding NtrC family response regulator